MNKLCFPSGEISFDLAENAKPVAETIDRLESERTIRRLWDGDHTVWNPDPREIANRLGWLRLPGTMPGETAAIESFAAGIRDEGFNSVLLLGMGGSSLAPEMYGKIFGSDLDYRVLDSTAPDAVLEVSEAVRPRKTLFLVSTKSGGTVETLSLFRYFFDLKHRELGDEAGSRFAAVTDPGSSLAATAERLKFRRVFLNDPDLGGRYSALSHFGLVPAALCRADLGRLLESAAQARRACLPERPARENPGAVLGAAMGGMARLGRDKLTFYISPRIASLGNWLEQLIAESTGKEGNGILPVIGEKPGGPYGPDRLFVFLELAGEEFPNSVHADISRRGHPAIRIRLNDVYGIGGQIFTWEMATALAGAIFRINPFDQPDVESTKEAARGIAQQIENGTFVFEKGDSSVPGISLPGRDRGSPPERPDVALRRFLALSGKGGYFVVQAYLKPSPENDRSLGEICELIRQITGAAVAPGYGPRYLHSTGQLHKGDAGKGLFIQFSAAPRRDVPIPGSGISFGALTVAELLGDRKALIDAGRKVIGFHFDDPGQGLEYVIESLKIQL